MAHTIARVRIGDFDQFIQTFSTLGAAKRAEHGCRGARVFRSTEDPHEVTTLFDWDRAGVEAFLEDADVPDIMQTAGLEAPPEFTFVDQVADLDS
jgi:quinol monooxygenase YgiN